jgi:hypothetical protein
MRAKVYSPGGEVRQRKHDKICEAIQRSLIAKGIRIVKWGYCVILLSRVRAADATSNSGKGISRRQRCSSDHHFAWQQSPGPNPELSKKIIVTIEAQLKRATDIPMFAPLEATN